MTTSYQVSERSTFTVDGQGALYTLGDPDNPSLVLNGVDADGCAWVTEEPEGWDAPSIATPSDSQPAGHGSWLGESFYEERVLTFTEGLCTAPNRQALGLARRRLLRALTASLSGLIRYTQHDEAPRRHLWVRPIGKPMIRLLDDQAMVFSFVLVAEDPLKTGDPITVGPATMRQPGRVPGRRYPRRYSPLHRRQRDYGGGEQSRGLWLPNVGEEDAHAIYRINGPIDRPLLVFPGERLQTGLRLRLGRGDVARVDTRAGLVQLNGVNRYDALAAGSALPLIPQGGMEVELRSGAGTDWPDAQLYVDTAPTWL